jgi:hypothetical protein
MKIFHLECFLLRAVGIPYMKILEKITIVLIITFLFLIMEDLVWSGFEYRCGNT